MKDNAASEPDIVSEKEAMFNRLSRLTEEYISTHIAKLKRENDASRPSVRAVLPFWDRLAEPPLRDAAAKQLSGLLESALRSDVLRYSTQQHRDVSLITSVVPAFEPFEAQRYFEPDGYADFTVVRAGAGGAIEHGLWVAHWTLCTDGRHNPIVHLTALPPLRMVNERGALMLWAQDLFTAAGWRALQEMFS
jgi:hypothetical protein